MSHRAYDPDQVERQTQLILSACGVPAEDARETARCLMFAERRGVGTHGLFRLELYVTRLMKGGVNPKPKLEIISDAPSTALIDGDNGLGPVAGARAMQLAIEKAERTGAGVVAVRRSNHCGSSAYYSNMAGEREMIGLAMTNVVPSMKPPGGNDRLIGNNVLSIGFPFPEDAPILFDAAMSRSSWGALLVARETGQPLPEGCFLDADGKPTRDAQKGAQRNGGALVPIGEHKGFGLALAIALLTGALSGGELDPALKNPYQESESPGDNAFLMIALRIASFVPVADFKAQTEDLSARIRASKPLDGHAAVRTPGERGARTAKANAKSINIEDVLMQKVEQLARDAGAPWEL